MKDFLRYHKYSVIISLSVAVFYAAFGYDLVRSDFIKLISLYAGLFFLSFKLIQVEKTNFKLLAGLAVLYRLIFIMALPNLSQDFFRFIWDGRLLAEGISPYLSTPESFTGSISQGPQLIAGMGSLSAGNFTSYPPVNQMIFGIAAFLAENSIIASVLILRLFIIAADLGTLYFGSKLLGSLNLPKYRIFWYILNPFILIELTGNLHFEGVMLFFLVWSLYLLHRRKWIWSAVLLGISVSVKLLPLLFLPLLLKYFNNRTTENSNTSLGLGKLTGFYAVTVATVLISFLPFLSAELISNFTESIGLWFQKFEFNASIYYIVRWIGFQVKGYNIIATAGKILPVMVILILTGLSFFRKNNNTERLISSMLLGISAYFFLSTTIHPWYIATPLMLSVFTRYRFALAWSFVVFFSYYAYGSNGFQENLWIVGLEYLLVFGALSYEVFGNKPLEPQALASDLRKI
ncbi:glycosyltransferase 87 family protein [Salegentibacter chungangensis]|uniref:Glycosyltransferase 87 family protein n=1 Tax=Salegentibacter chungangensis TaxID=1335724 RepID=A0ABW3NMY3_9FLAO